MNSLLYAMDLVLTTLRPVLLGVATVTGVVCLLDWMVRTRRIRPFSPVTRFFRTTIEPLMLPIERRIVRSGGLPAHAKGKPDERITGSNGSEAATLRKFLLFTERPW